MFCGCLFGDKISAETFTLVCGMTKVICCLLQRQNMFVPQLIFDGSGFSLSDVSTYVQT